jgi:hypothetical protein
MHKKVPDSELLTKELLIRLLNLHTDIVMDNYYIDTPSEVKETDRLVYKKCLDEMLERIKKLEF